MNKERVYQIILKPVMSEKANMAADKYGQIVFWVLPNARKKEIRTAIEELFSVKVKGVQVLTLRGKKKRLGRKNHSKKAYVSLEKGYDIDLFEITNL